jgi:hypothetical protein
MALKKPRIATSIWRSQIALRILADMVFWSIVFPGHCDGGGFLYGYSILT